MDKTAKRWTKKVPRRGPSGAALFRNDVPNPTTTGGNPARASNAALMAGTTFVERFDGGAMRGTSYDAEAPIHPGDPATNTGYVIPAAIPGWLMEKVRKSKKIAAALRLDDVLTPERSQQLRDGLRRDYDDFMTWLREEMKNVPQLAAGVAKTAGESNEPALATHASAPPQQLRPRAEIVVASPDGVLAIDKGDYILFPGGGIDDGEPAVIGAVREAIEEADVHVLNIAERDVVESMWPEGVNDFWDDSDFAGERTYFFTAIDGGRLGTTHDDREDFEVIPYATLLKRFDELMSDPEAWDYRNNEVRRSLVRAAEGMVGREDAWKPKKLARAPRHTSGGWGHYRNALRRIFLPEDPKAFVAAIQAVEEELGHHVDEVRRFPTGAVLVVLRTHDGDRPVTARDHALARRINTLAKTAGALPCDTMSLTAGADHFPDTAPGLLVDLDGTIVDSEWEDQSGVLVRQSPRKGVKEALTAAAAAGVRIVGITNRSADPEGMLSTPEDIERYNAEVMAWFPELADVVFCGDYHDPARKPSPDMLEFARHHFNLDPVLAMIGDSEDDAAAAEAAGILHLSPEAFFDSPECRAALLEVVGSEPCCTSTAIVKVADAAALKPRDEFFYTNPEGAIFARRVGDRRLEFPTTGRGKRAPYSNPLRVVPDDGIDEPGYHGYTYNFNVGSGDAPADFEGGEWIPAQDALKQIYGSMGLAVNKSHRELDRARARVLHRLAKRLRAPPQPEDEIGAGDPRPEEPESEFDLPQAVSGAPWDTLERDFIKAAAVAAPVATLEDDDDDQPSTAVSRLPGDLALFSGLGAGAGLVSSALDAGWQTYRDYPGVMTRGAQAVDSAVASATERGRPAADIERVRRRAEAAHLPDQSELFWRNHSGDLIKRHLFTGMGVGAATALGVLAWRRWQEKRRRQQPKTAAAPAGHIFTSADIPDLAREGGGPSAAAVAKIVGAAGAAGLGLGAVYNTLRSRRRDEREHDLRYALHRLRRRRKTASLADLTAGAGKQIHTGIGKADVNPMWAGAGVGAALGGLAGMGHAFLFDDDDGPSDWRTYVRRGLVGAGVGAGAGAGAGAVYKHWLDPKRMPEGIHRALRPRPEPTADQWAEFYLQNVKDPEARAYFEANRDDPRHPVNRLNAFVAQHNEEPEVDFGRWAMLPRSRAARDTTRGETESYRGQEGADGFTLQDLYDLGFFDSAVAVPELGQSRWMTWRHPQSNLHWHDHPKNWNAHIDDHPASQVLLKRLEEAGENPRSPANIIRAAVYGAPHAIGEGLPGWASIGIQWVADRPSPSVEYAVQDGVPRNELRGVAYARPDVIAKRFALAAGIPISAYVGMKLPGWVERIQRRREEEEMRRQRVPA
jgi:histidinol phosphatase-like enzyme/8-oxo-dGTP pyrophosphatase MutT (NUDIX family)/pterin-4a-carbinolamine dehydratase